MPETGFEKMFGFGSLESASYSINHIVDYLVRMNTLPLSLLSIIGLIYGFYKKDALVISWSIALLPGFFYGYYSRRVLFSAPLAMLLASIAISLIWHKLPVAVSGFKKSFKNVLGVERFLRVIIVGLIIVFSVNSILVSYSYVTDLPNSSAPSIEKEIYVSRYTSGYGVSEAIGYIESVCNSGLIITDTPNQFRYYLLNVSDRYEVVDLLSLNISQSGLLHTFSGTQKSVFVVVRWWNWVNQYLGNLTREDPGFPIRLAKVVNIPESNIDNKMMIYQTGKNVVWKIEDASFSGLTKWESNSSFVWDKYVLGWPETLLAYNLNRTEDNSLEMVIRGNSSWAWTVVGIKQSNPSFSEGNLTFNPVATVEVNLLNQTPGSYLEIQLSLFDGVKYRNLVYVNSHIDYPFPSDIFRNSSSTVYFIRNIPLASWTSINIAVRNDYDSYFVDHNYGYGLSLLSIGASTAGANLDFLLRKAEINYDCVPWFVSR
jgi:hypothetical protein